MKKKRKHTPQTWRNSSKVAFLLERGKALSAQRQWNRAIPWFEEVLRLESTHPEAMTGLAQAFLRCGLLYSAKSYFEKCSDQSAADRHISTILSNLARHPATKKENVTFYIPCYNAEKYIARCIEGVLAQSYPIKEILVIDDGSKDATVKRASRYPVKIIRHPCNRGLSAARNTALEQATGDFIASIDADVVPDRFWLENLMRCFIAKEVGGAGGKLIEAHTVTAVDRWRQVNMPQYPGEQRKVNPFALCGCGTVYLTKCLRELGGYNEKFRNNHEDLDLSFRAKMLKYKLVYTPKAIARHLRTDSIKSVLTTYWRWYVITRGEILGRFANFDTLTSKAKQNLGLSMRMVSWSYYYQRFHLLYLDILCGIRSVLADIVHIAHCSHLPKDMVSQTLLVTLAGFRYALKQRGASGELVRYIMEDVSDLLEFLGEEYASYLKKLETLFPDTSLKLSDNYARIKSIFPRAQISFIDASLTLWNKKFALEPMAWKMTEVSARRMRQEQEDNPEERPGLRVLLLNPPWRAEGRFGVRAGSRWPFTMNVGDEGTIPFYIPFPFFMAYTVALLKGHNLNPVMVDAIAEGLTDEEFLERVRGFVPDVVLIEASTPSIEHDLEWARKIKESLGSKVVFVGPHVSALGVAFLTENSDVDYCIVGEYEFAFLELVKSVQKGRSAKGIAGVIYRDRDGRIVSQGRSKGVTRLDDLPLPERLSLPLYNYNGPGAGLLLPVVQMMSSRGCPFGCIFCLWPQVLYGNKTYRTRDPRRVVDEMEMLVKEYGFKSAYFDDDTFNIGKDRILKLCDLIQKRGLKVSWSAMARADASDYETLKAMKKAGLCAIKFGVESGSQELLDSCGKALKLSRVSKAVADCKRLGIEVHLTFTFGLPRETRKTAEETMRYALQMDPFSVQFSLVTPFPGTAYYRILIDAGQLATKEWARYDGDRYAVFRAEHLSPEELEAELERARRAWSDHCQRRRINTLFAITGESKESDRGDGKKRIAIVDLLFIWPPRGGAAYDISAVGSHLRNEGFDVQMFVPLSMKPFPRGYIGAPFLFPIQQIFFNKNTFTPEIVSRKLKEAVDSFDPDYVIVGDGWGLKPYVVKALAGYRTFLRFYAHENLCLISNGISLRGDAICPYNFLEHRAKCLECVTEQILKHGTKHWNIYELLISKGFTEEFHELVKDSLRQVQGIIVYNAQIAKLVSRFNKNVYIIPTGVSFERFALTPALLQKPKDPRINIVMSGRVDDRAKGFHILKQACEKLYLKRKDFVLTITTGEGMEEAFIKPAGWISQEVIPGLYLASDICVIPSIWPEPFGIVAVEAMAAGKPVIASRVGGLQNIVVDGTTGFLVEPGNVDELANKIEILMDNPLLRKEMGKKGRELAEKLYNWPDILKKHYLPLVAPRKRKSILR